MSLDISVNRIFDIKNVSTTVPQMIILNKEHINENDW